MAMAFSKRHQIREMCKVFETGKMTPNKNRGGNVEFTYVDKANKEVLMQVKVELEINSSLTAIFIVGVLFSIFCCYFNDI